MAATTTLINVKAAKKLRKLGMMVFASSMDFVAKLPHQWPRID